MNNEQYSQYSQKEIEKLGIDEGELYKEQVMSHFEIKKNKKIKTKFDISKSSKWQSSSEED